MSRFKAAAFALTLGTAPNPTEAGTPIEPLPGDNIEVVDANLPVEAERESTSTDVEKTLETPEQAAARADLETKASQGLEAAAEMELQVLDTGAMSVEQVAQFKEMAERDDESGIMALISSLAGALEGQAMASEGGEHGESQESNGLILAISFISLFYFSRMMYRAARYNEPISFLNHHLAFAVGLVGMATQMPEEIMHGLIESGVAFAAIMGVTRISRGVINKVNLGELEEEQAKAVMYVFGMFGNIINPLATGTILSPLMRRMKVNDRYIAVQNVSNIDGGFLPVLGGFPGIVALNKLGFAEGLLFQIGVMTPIILFQKLWQLYLWRPKFIKHAGIIWDIFRGMRFDTGMLWSKYTKHHEKEVVREIAEEFKGKLEAIKAQLGDEYSEILQAIDESTNAVVTEIAPEDESKVEEYRVTQEAKKLLEEYMRDPNSEERMGSIVSVLLRAIRDGVIKREELLELRTAGGLQGIYGKIKNRVPQGLTAQIDQAFATFCGWIHASHNEAEIMRIFTVQAMTVPLLIPGTTLVLGALPRLKECTTGGMTLFADNYAATAVHWDIDAPTALAVSICLGGGTIYGGMPNLNLLGRYANLGESIKAAKYLIPTAIFLLAYLNMGWDGKTAAAHSVETTREVAAWVFGAEEASAASTETSPSSTEEGQQ